MTDGTVHLTTITVDGLNTLNIGDFQRVNDWEWMSSRVKILKYIPDDEKIFPRGKWATIQEMERQIEENAKYRAEQVEAV